MNGDYIDNSKPAVCAPPPTLAALLAPLSPGPDAFPLLLSSFAAKHALALPSLILGDEQPLPSFLQSIKELIKF